MAQPSQQESASPGAEQLPRDKALTASLSASFCDHFFTACKSTARHLFDEVASGATRHLHDTGSLMLSAHRRGVRAVGMLEEQSTSPRVSMRAQVICIVDSRTTRGVSWNLSKAGMQVEEANLKPKEVVQLSFSLTAFGCGSGSCRHRIVGTHQAARNPLHRRWHTESAVNLPVHRTT